jgi:hypothetical protein
MWEVENTMRVWLKQDRMRAYNISTEKFRIYCKSVLARPGRLGSSSGIKSPVIRICINVSR